MRPRFKLEYFLNFIDIQKNFEPGDKIFSTEAIFAILNDCLYELMSNNVPEYAQSEKDVPIYLTSRQITILLPPHQLRRSKTNPEELCLTIPGKTLGKGRYGTVEEQKTSITFKFNREAKSVLILEIKYNNKKAGKNILSSSASNEEKLIRSASLYNEEKIRIFQGSEQAYISMPKIPDRALNKIDWPSTPKIKWFLTLYSLLDPVVRLHTKNIIHHDLKPANLMKNITTLLITPVDFGLSRRYPSLGRPGTPGTPLYFSPEKFLEWRGRIIKNENIAYLKRSEGYTLAFLSCLLFLNEHSKTAEVYLLEKIKAINIQEIKDVNTGNLTEDKKQIQLMLVFSQNENVFLQVWDTIFNDLSAARVPAYIITIIKKMLSFNNADRLTPEEVLAEFCPAATMPLLQELKGILIGLISNYSKANLILIQGKIKTEIEKHTLQLAELELSFFRILPILTDARHIIYLNANYDLLKERLHDRIQKLDHLKLVAADNLQQLRDLLQEVSHGIDQNASLSSEKIGKLFKRLYITTQVKKVEVPITVVPPLTIQYNKLLPSADPPRQSPGTNSFLAVRAPLKPIGTRNTEAQNQTCFVLNGVRFII